MTSFPPELRGLVFFGMAMARVFKIQREKAAKLVEFSMKKVSGPWTPVMEEQASGRWPQERARRRCKAAPTGRWVLIGAGMLRWTPAGTGMLFAERSLTRRWMLASVGRNL